MSATPLSTTVVTPFGPGPVASAPLTVVPWSRYGNRRLYVKTQDGQDVGWVDLLTGDRSLAMPELAPAFELAVSASESVREDPARSYTPRRAFGARDEHAVPADALPARRYQPEPVDLMSHRPGELLEAQIEAALRDGRELTPARPDFSGRRAYSSWELGVLGEQMVAEELDRLVGLDPRWSFLNSIPVGANNSDIDHLVVGPGGVFTINAKHHHDGKVWVGGDAVNVNGTWQHYVRSSRFEAERAGKLLTAAARTEVSVRGLVVPVGAELVVREQPTDVMVLDGSQLVDFLIAQPAVLDTYQVVLVRSCARLSSTWR